MSVGFGSKNIEICGKCPCFDHYFPVCGYLQAEGRVFESQPRQTQEKQVVTAPLPNAEH